MEGDVLDNQQLPAARAIAMARDMVHSQGDQIGRLFSLEFFSKSYFCIIFWLLFPQNQL
jgi:hypothetical protein